MPPSVPVMQRIQAKIKTTDTGCWEWQGHVDAFGYGKIRYLGKPVTTHRAAYLEMVGPIPEGLQIDHKCRNRACCNPEHLEAVTPAENVRRGNAAQPQTVKACRKGHDRTPENTRVNCRGQAICIICDRAAAESRKGKTTRLRSKTHCRNGHEYTPDNTCLTPTGIRRCISCRRKASKAHCKKVRSENTRPKVVKTHCPQGHPYDGDNLVINTVGARCCRICLRVAWTKHNGKRPTKRGASCV